jgi:hypothetical protein
MHAAPATRVLALAFAMLGAAAVLAYDAPRGTRGKSKDYQDAIAKIVAQAKAKEPSQATGTVSDGKLANAAELPAKGFGYRLADGKRKTHFGTDEMVFGIMELAALLQERHPGTPWLSVGDIAGPEGGKLDPHINHQDGQDVDLAYLYMTADGKPADRGWIKCDAEGNTKQAAIKFDVARNFEMLAFWLDSPYFGGCEWILVYAPIEKLLVAHGRDLAKKQPKKAEAIGKLTDELEELMREPESSPHDDHFHIRLRRKPAQGR